VNPFFANRFKVSDTCRTCFEPMSGDNLFIDKRGVRHCRACWRRGNARKVDHRRKARANVISAPIRRRTVLIDHTKCVPPDSLCRECQEIWNEVNGVSA
jgi:hypothetical protein